MLTLSLIFFLVYFSSHFYVIIIGRFKSNKKNTFKYDVPKINLEDLTVIIPFRNEYNRIIPLLNSIKNSSKYPKRIIFVDDHSDDNTSILIDETLQDISISVLKLKEEEFGKKSAINLGVQHSKTRFVLTLDADICFQETYFNELTKIQEKNLVILPVRFNCTTVFSSLLHMDVILLNELNYGLSGISHPIVASGANLIFEKEYYLKFNSLKNHKHILSGDDMFLLRDFKNNNCSIQTYNSTNLSVSTNVPKMIWPIFQQRLRWIKKTEKIKDFRLKFWGVYEVLIHFLFLGLVVFSIYKQEYKLCLALIGLKLLFDSFFYLKSLFNIFNVSSILLLFLYQFFFPIYSFSVLSLLFFTKLRWKGRTI